MTENRITESPRVADDPRGQFHMARDNQSLLAADWVGDVCGGDGPTVMQLQRRCNRNPQRSAIRDQSESADQILEEKRLVAGTGIGRKSRGS